MSSFSRARACSLSISRYLSFYSLEIIRDTDVNTPVASGTLPASKDLGVSYVGGTPATPTTPAIPATYYVIIYRAADNIVLNAVKLQLD